jgi:hypothetical protein
VSRFDAQVRTLLANSPSLMGIRIIVEESIEEVLANAALLVRFSENLVSFLQMISKPLSLG